jgi:energy-coupling factor transport system ATP-binding protein
MLLQNINLELHAGEIVAVLGANGVGKTSLLLSLAGLLTPAAGQVTGARPGMVFQNPEHQFVSTTVRGEVGYGVASGYLVEDLLVEHRLEHLADQNPYSLSGGEKRRLSVAAMLAHSRTALLADEPTFGLDRRATIAAIGAFRAAAAEGRAVLLSSHDLRTVATMAHRAVVVAEGTIIADAPIFEVLRDREALARAGLTLPPLIDWLLDTVGTADAIRRILHRLDGMVAGTVLKEVRL